MRQDSNSLLEGAIDIAIQYHRASTALFQRKLKIGYFLAANLLQQLEDLGMVTKADGAKPRKIMN